MYGHLSAYGMVWGWKRSKDKKVTERKEKSNLLEACRHERVDQPGRPVSKRQLTRWHVRQQTALQT